MPKNTSHDYLRITPTQITYDQAPVEMLLERAHDFASENPELSFICASGVLRALLNQPMKNRGDKYVESLSWTTDFAGEINSSEEFVQPCPERVLKFISHLPPVSGIIDTATIRATEVNRPAETAEVIEAYVERNSSKLFIILGHGGIASGFDTYPYLSGKNNAKFPVRFSRYKMGDKLPYLSNGEQQLLKSMTLGRSVVVYDEDRTEFGETMRWATEYFGNILGVTITGVTPALSLPSHAEYSPKVIQKHGGE